MYVIYLYGIMRVVRVKQKQFLLKPSIFCQRVCVCVFLYTDICFYFRVGCYYAMTAKALWQFLRLCIMRLFYFRTHRRRPKYLVFSRQDINLHIDSGPTYSSECI